MLKKKKALPPSLLGFEGINRYWDPTRNAVTAKILPGEYYVSKTDEYIATVLGSCISACIRDEIAGVGGMNHYMLPADNSDLTESFSNDANRYGNWAMENLINTLIRYGASRERMEIKIFGGSRIINSKQLDIGERNVMFIFSYLITENMKAFKQDVGGPHPRKVYYHPLTGKVFVKKLDAINNETLFEREREYCEQVDRESRRGGDVELF